MLSFDDAQAFFDASFVGPHDDYALFHYQFETRQDPTLVAATLASEQSTAQWRRVGLAEDFRPLHGAKVIALKETEGQQRSYRASIAHPHRNFGPRIPNLLSAAAGEGPFYCPGIETIKWLDFDLPPSFLAHFQGPQFGLGGIRALLDVHDRPLFVGVVKPNIGLAPQDFADLAYEAWMGGLDIAKDDEMLADTEWSPLSERCALVGLAREKAERETGQKKIFVANLTDEIDAIPKLYEQAVDRNINTVMLNSLMTGFSALRVLRKSSRIPVMAHFTGTAPLSQIPNFGISSKVIAKLQRLCGADFVVLAGFGERMHRADFEVLEDMKACLEPWGPILPSLPIPGGSDSAATLASVYEKIGHPDFGFICGRGVFGYPGGPQEGARSLHEAWKKIRERVK